MVARHSKVLEVLSVRKGASRKRTFDQCHCQGEDFFISWSKQAAATVLLSSDVAQMNDRRIRSRKYVKYLT